MGVSSRGASSRLPSAARTTARARWSRFFENYLLGPEALPTVLEIDGDDSSTTTADVLELQLQIESAAEEG